MFRYTGSYKHAGGDVSMFTCEARLVTPAATYGYDVSHSGSAQQFTSRVVIKNAYKYVLNPVSRSQTLYQIIKVHKRFHLYLRSSMTNVLSNQL